MKRPVLVLAALLASFAGVAMAQSAPLRGVGMLALNAADATSVPGGRNSLVEIPDSGGGGAAVRGVRGGGDSATAARHAARESTEPMLPDALPSVGGTHAGDPTVPISATPKKPTYRWQSLVPGAIK